jgi:hypothetical protein
MKTTVELPDELYREAKTRAAAQKRRIRELIAEGIEKVLAESSQGGATKASAQVADSTASAEDSLRALDAIRFNAPAANDRIGSLVAEARKSRRAGWNREDLQP